MSGAGKGAERQASAEAAGALALVDDAEDDAENDDGDSRTVVHEAGLLFCRCTCHITRNLHGAHLFHRLLHGGQSSDLVIIMRHPACPTIGTSRSSGSKLPSDKYSPSLRRIC